MTASRLRISRIAAAALVLAAFLCNAAPVRDDQKKIYIDEQLRLAEGLKGRGNYTTAIEEYQNIIRRFSDDPLAADAWAGLAETHCLMGNYKEGIAVYDKFLEKFPEIRTSGYVRIARARAIIGSGDKARLDEALASISSIAESGKEEKLRDFAAYSLGKVYAGLGRKDEAEKQFQKLSGAAIRSQEDIYKIYGRIELALLVRENDSKRSLAILDNLGTLKMLDDSQRNAIRELVADILFESRNYQAAAGKYKELYLDLHGTEDGDRALLRMVESLYLFGGTAEIIRGSEGYLRDTALEYNRPKLMYYVALASEKENDNKSAEDIARKIIAGTPAADPDTIEKAGILLVRVLRKQDRPADAIQEAENMISGGALSPKGRIELARETLRIENPECVASLYSLLKTASDKASAGFEKDSFAYEKGLLDVRQNKVADAMAAFNSIMSPEIRPYALFENGKCLEKLGRGMEAAAVFEKIPAEFPGCRLAPAAALKSATIRIGQGQAAEGIKALEGLLAGNPDPGIRPEILFYLGFANMRLERFAEAEKYLAEAAADQGKSEMSRVAATYLCWNLLLQKKWPEAEKSAARLIGDAERLRNSDPAFLLLLGKSSLENGRDEYAEKCFDALSICSDSALRFEGIFNSALLDRKAGRAGKAVEKLKIVVKSDSADPDLYCRACASLGDILRESGNSGEATIYYEKSIEVPKNRNAATRARLGLARLLAASPEHLERAASYAVQVIVLSEDPETVQEAMVLNMDLLLRLGRKADAEAALEEMKRKFPRSTERKDARETIEKFGR